MPPTSSDLSPIHRLPPELIDSLLLYVPPDQLQHTALALAHVFPNLAISPRHLFTHLRVGRPEQMRPMWERLRREMYPDEEEREHEDHDDVQSSSSSSTTTSHPLAPGLLRHTRSFTLACFSGSADILNNILRLIPLITHLSLNLGTNFAPEHLAEAFQVDRPFLKVVEVRFRPYVDRATYYQFLKGSYFDTAIETMTRQWPERPEFTHFSIVQDVPPRFSVPHLVKKMARIKLAKEMTREREERAALKHAGEPGGKAGQVQADDDGVVNEQVRVGLPSSEDELEGDMSEGEDGDEAWDAMMDTTPVEPAKGYTGHGPFPYLSGRLAEAKPLTFAQPVVFHDITCLARLARSPAARHVRDLRLRCPGRDVVRTLAEGPGDSPGDAQGRRWFPRLRYLDVSTSNVRMDGHLPALLRRYGSLEHLVLDRTNLFGFRGKDGGKELCAELARLISGMSGIQRAKERERELSKLEEDERRRQAMAERERLKRLRIEQPVREQDEEERTAGNDDADEGDEDEIEYDEDGEIIVRPPRPPPAPEPEPEPMVYRPAERARARRARRTIAMSSFSVRENTRRNRAHDRTDEERDSDLVIPPAQTITMVLPSLSRLKSINLGGEALPLDQTKLDAWDKGFRAGWKDGLDKAYEWATRVGERYDRAQKAADSWRSAEELERMRTGGKNHKMGGGKQQSTNKGPSPLMMPNGKPRTKPPLDVRLYRYPWPEEEIDDKEFNPEDPHGGLIRVGPDENWKDVYLRYLGEAGARVAADTTVLQREDAPVVSSLSTHNSGPVLCCIPDCEGPMRKGDGGERVDGRGGMKIVNGQIVVRGGFKHTPGCGHEYGATVFSKQT